MTIPGTGSKLLRAPVERFGLVSCDFFGHVQQQFLVAGFHFRDEPAQFGEVSGFACASKFVILRRLHLPQTRRRFTIVE